MAQPHRPGAFVRADTGYGAPGTGDRRSGGGTERADATAEAEQGGRAHGKSENCDFGDGFWHWVHDGL